MCYTKSLDFQTPKNKLLTFLIVYRNVKYATVALKYNCLQEKNKQSA